MKKAVAYCRFSSDNQRTESILAQVRAIEDYCKKEGFTLVKIYKDEAISGTSTDDREQFLEMIADSKKKEFNYVIVHKFDRFARNRYDHAIYERELNENNVKLISVLEQLNDSPEAVILKSVLTGMNEYYSLNLAREVRKGQKENALKCIHNGGIPPLGYNLTNEKTYIINETEAQAVKLIFKMYLEGRGYSYIADELNSLGFKNKLGKPFKKLSIRDTLKNEKYSGIYTFGKKDKKGKLTGKEIKIENGIPAIISKEDFEKVQIKLKRRIRNTTGRSTALTPYLLTGLCMCGECGGTYSGGYRTVNRNKTIYYGYQCRNRKDKITNCKNTPIRRELLEKLIISILKENIFSAPQIDIVAEKVFSYIKNSLKQSNTEIKKIEKNISKLQEKLSKLLDYSLDGIISDCEYKEKKEKIDMEILSLKEKKLEYSNSAKIISKEQIKNHLIELGQNLDSKDDTLIQIIIQTFVKKIIIHRTEITVEIRLFPGLDMVNNGGDDGN
ncbi:MULTISPECIES: recombinase family protein [Fusobacterium]|uniref:recombinase family protein n=1 Tax=Fusobacterium TaxID=848 RepID=UPI001476CA0D|nr:MULTISPECIES: recombinase family protein [Fusobacterium]NME35604.1 recombinase family protein [Fusobacterium sp. FSA-380-WT-3A]